MTQLELADVFTDTEKLVASKYGTGGVETVFYDGNAPIPYGEGQYDTPITFVRGGTAGVGYNLAEGMKVAVLNFADALRFGGWVEDGAPTQEEDLCRCTNLFNVLSREECHINYYAPNIDFVRFHRGREVYLDNIIYAKGITVFKDDTTYKEIAPRKFDVITCPAPATILRADEAFDIYIQRIYQIVYSAIDNGAECIVLGAWGCGAFCQDPHIMAKAFACVLADTKDYFKQVVFAFRLTPNWGKQADMYDVFKTEFTRLGLEVENG